MALPFSLTLEKLLVVFCNVRIYTEGSMHSLMLQLEDLPAFVVDIIRLGAWYLLLLIVFVPLERLFPVHPQKIFRKAFLVDFGYYFVSGLVPKALLVFPVAAVAWGMHRLVPSAVHEWAAALPLAPRLLAALVVGEFGFYWGHRWTHEIPLLWRFHSIHHSAEEMDWMVSTRGHPVDIAFTRLCGLVPMYALGLAQPAAGGRLDVMPLIILLIGQAWGFFIHSNLRWRFGWLSLLISTPAFHHWHHTNDDRRDRNYASMLPIMDKLFGTWHMPRKQWPPCYGIDGPMAPGLAGQLIQPFLPRHEKAQSMGVTMDENRPAPPVA
jgi:sterol desaturase/sphingolipid hydroxylase (fatty acid hydroxylase superfamily)